MSTNDETTATPAALSAISLDFSLVRRAVVIFLAYLIITLGQPAFVSLFSALAASVGYALFFTQIASYNVKWRFIYGFSFFFAVQAVQLFWFTYHPISAVCAGYLLLCFLMALQFALLSALASKKMFESKFQFLAIPAFWTILEWSRIYWCSGFYFDLSGLALAGNLVTLQTASLFGVLGMSFWIMLSNVYIAKASLFPKMSSWVCAAALVAMPFLYGTWHLLDHSAKQKVYDAIHPPIRCLIVHTKRVPDEFKKGPPKNLSPQERAISEWQEIANAIAPYNNQTFDLMLMPEGVVSYGSTSLLFTQNEIRHLFQNTLNTTLSFGKESLLCSEDIAQGVSSHFSSPLIIGLEGIQPAKIGERTRYSNSAFFFTPHARKAPERYDKQVLVPMGEYIPLDWAKKIAAKYGVYDSFTPGTEARLFVAGNLKIGPSVCYEETVGSLIRKNAQKGANLLVNLTDDYWFPYSTLAVQHYEHARPRTLENGTPLIRSCNFGISGAIDSLGRTIAAKEGNPDPSAFVVSVSSYHYPTLYGRFGDTPILMLSVLICLACAISLFPRWK